MEWAMATRQERHDWVRENADGSASASILAERAGTTRNAVLGVAHKIGISLLGEKPKQAGAAAVPRQHAEPKRRVMPPPKSTYVRPVPLREGEPAPSATIGTLTASRCHFPMWHDGDERSVEPTLLPYCGALIAYGASYCEHHRPRVFTPVAKSTAVVYNRGHGK